MKTDLHLASDSFLRVIKQREDAAQMASSAHFTEGTHLTSLIKAQTFCAGGVGALASCRLSH